MDTIDFNKHDIDIFINFAKKFAMADIETNRAMNDDTTQALLSFKKYVPPQ